MRYFLLFATLLGLFHGCKSPENSGATPQPPVELPQSVKELVYQKYPSAHDLRLVSEIEKGRVYELSFDHNNVDHDVVVSKSGILRVTTTTGEEVPDSLVAKLDTLAIKGGKLSNYRSSVYYDNSAAYAADYELNDRKYVMLFYDNAIMLADYEWDFRTNNILDLPTSIQQFIAARNKPNPRYVNSLVNLNEASRKHIINNNELTFTDCQVMKMLDGSKQYSVLLNYLGATTLASIFNENGQMIFPGSFNRIRQFERDFNGTPALWATNLTKQEVSYFRDLFAGSSHFFGFHLDGFSNFRSSFRNEYEESRGYTFQLYNGKGEFWILSYGADKKPVSSFYRSN